MRPQVDEVAALPERVRLAFVDRARRVATGGEPLGERFALSPVVVSASMTADLDALGEALRVVLRDSLPVLRARPALLRRLALGPAALSRVHRRFGMGLAQFAAFAPPTFLLSHRPDLPDMVVRARLDTFVVDGALRAIELNVGNMPCNVLDELARAFEASPELAALVDGAERPRSSAALADALMSRHQMRFGEAPGCVAQIEHPNAPSSDAAGLVAALEARGARVLRVGPGALRATRRSLLCRGVPVTLLSEECSALPSSLSRFGFAARVRHKLQRMRALRAGTALVYPSPLESIFNKAYLALLSEGAFDGAVHEASLERLRSAIVCTRVTRKGASTWEGERVADLQRFALGRQRELVLKPIVGYRSLGVLLGDRATGAEWKRRVEDAFVAGDSVLQERVRPAPSEVLLPNQERAPAWVDLCPIFVDGRVVAATSRFSVGDELLGFCPRGEAPRGPFGLVPVWFSRGSADR